MEKYYKITNKSLAYIAAIILDLNAKWKYIKNNQAEDWVLKAKKLIEKLQIEYKPTDLTSFTLFIVMPDPSKNAFATWKKRYQLVLSVKDEYKRYYIANCTYKVNLRMWQLETTQQVNYPNLSKLVLDILSIPAMSANPKRLFSSAKLLITNLRNKLGIDITKAFECLKSQYKIKG